MNFKSIVNWIRPKLSTYDKKSISKLSQGLILDFSNFYTNAVAKAVDSSFFSTMLSTISAVLVRYSLSFLNSKIHRFWTLKSILKCVKKPPKARSAKSRRNHAYRYFSQEKLWYARFWLEKIVPESCVPLFL